VKNDDKPQSLLLLLSGFLLASCSQDPHSKRSAMSTTEISFFEKAKYKEASIMYRRALQKDLKFGEAYYKLGLTEIRMQAYGDAVRALRRAIEMQPTNADATTKLAEIY